MSHCPHCNRVLDDGQSWCDAQCKECERRSGAGPACLGVCCLDDDDFAAFEAGEAREEKLRVLAAAVLAEVNPGGPHAHAHAVAAEVLAGGAPSGPTN